jgi:RimJ/RimL family protein N-acetyltransferase
VVEPVDPWPVTPTLRSLRLRLEPLRVEHAEELAPLLDDPGLHRFIGGRPASVAELSDRYRRQAQGRSPDGSQGWCNWIVRRSSDAQAVGTVQATLSRSDGGLVAEVAWVTATAYQGQGYASEAATAMATWLRSKGASFIVAHIHPGHRASGAVAAAIGLSPSAAIENGEVRWEA